MVVLIRADSGYEPNPGHPGTGTIVEIVCGPGGDEPGTLSNISTRMRVEAGDGALIGGLMVRGNNPKRLLVRAIGPSMTGIDDQLSNPTLELMDAAGHTIAFNDNWNDAPNVQEIVDSTIPPQNELESAILMNLAPGDYTAIVRGADNASGMALVEAYDLSRSDGAKLANISTRGSVETGDNAMIGGFTVLGARPVNILVRAVGPSLPMSGTLANPTLEMRDSTGTVIGTNDDWRTDQEAAITATGMAPGNDLESAIVQQFGPGQFTAIVRGFDDGTGVACVEIYAIP